MSDSGKMASIITVHKATVAILKKVPAISLIDATDLLLHQKDEIKAYINTTCSN